MGLCNKNYHSLTEFTVYKDVENIEPLTKDDILAFYREQFLPSSPLRTKGSVWLIAQSSAADIAANTSDSDKKEKLLAMVSQILEQMGLEVDSVALSKQFDSVDIGAADVEGIVGAVGTYLTDVVGVAKEEAEQVLEQGKIVIAGVLPSLGILAPEAQENGDAAHANGEANGEVDGVESKTVLIEDVKEWKATIRLSAGARPVKDLREFEETGPKL